MLTPAECEVLPRLAVFVGGFSRAAAEDVTGARLPLLAALVDKSLLRSSGDGRFSMHPLLRQCALERLHDHQACRLKHAEHYMQMLARHGNRASAAGLAEIELDLPNCLATWQTSIDAHLADNLERMAPALGRLFDVRGRFVEGIELMQAAIRVLDAATPADRRALAMSRFVQSTFLARQGKLREAEDSARAALRLFAATRHRLGMTGSLNTLGVCLFMQGRYQDARACYARALRRSQRDGDDFQSNRVEVNLALLEETLGHYDEALVLYERTQAYYRQSHRTVELVHALNNIASVHRRRHDALATVAYAEEGLRLSRASNHRQNEPHLLSTLALGYLEAGDIGRGESAALQALEQARALGIGQIEIVALIVLAKAAAMRRHFVSAREHVCQSLRIAREMQQEVLQLDALSVDAQLAAANGERIRAAALWQFLATDPRGEMSERSDASNNLERLALTPAEKVAAHELAMRLTLETAVDGALAGMSRAATEGVRADAQHPGE
jgi:tetratricopeptide (TPR) repeat protein